MSDTATDLFGYYSQTVQSSRLFAAYQEWDKKNPHFYPLFVQFSKQLAERGYKQIGVALIFERIRWESMLKTTGEEWKLNNNYKAVYARRFMRDHPQYEDFFRLRELRAMTDAEAEKA